MSTNEKSPQMIRLLTALLLVGVFAAGTVTGAGLFRWVAFPPPFPHLKHGPPGMVGTLGPYSDLGLSDEQARKVRGILDAHRPELEAIMQETFPKLQVVLDGTDKEVGALLSPEQQAKLDQRKARWTHHRKAGPPGMPFPPGPPPGGPMLPFPPPPPSQDEFR
jgi:hypothetical protein